MEKEMEKVKNMLDYYIIFEEEYLNGKRNEKGKDYYYFGQLKFIDEYLNGKEWNGKGYEW